MSEARARDYAWGALGVLVALATVARVATCVFALVWALVHARWLGAVRVFVLNLPVALLLGWWLTMGAWRRTVWGEPSAEEKASANAPLTARQDRHLARWMVFSLACGVILAVTLTVQWVIGAR